MDDLIENYENIIDLLKYFRLINFQKLYFNLQEYDIKDCKEIIQLESGSQPPKSQHVYEKQKGYIRFIQNRDYASDNHITYIKQSNRNKICNKNDILIDKYGEAGTIRYGLEGAYNVALAKINTNIKNCNEYLRDFLSQKNVTNLLYSSSMASTRPSLNESSFIGIKIKIPNQTFLSDYEYNLGKLLHLEFYIKDKISILKQQKELLLKKYFG